MADEKKPRAGLNQVFVCLACSRTFLDRAATEPVDVEMSDAVVQVPTKVPHPRYPDDAELATTVWTDTRVPAVKIPARPAAPCCASHVRLCSSVHMRFSLPAGADPEVIGAEVLE